MKFRIRCIKPQDVSSVDWAKELTTKPWQLLTHSFCLFHLSLLSAKGEIIAHTFDDCDGKLKHDDDLSQKLYPSARKFFLDHLAKKAGQIISEQLIEPRWQTFKDGDKRYCELTFSDLNIACVLPGRQIEIAGILAGIGTIFELKDGVSQSLVLDETAVFKQRFENQPGIEMVEIRKRNGESETKVRVSLDLVQGAK